jgi:copper transport protein
MPDNDHAVVARHPPSRGVLMGSLKPAVRRGGLLATLALLLLTLFAPHAAAHAELVSISPANGVQLAKPPSEIKLTFTESVNLVSDGIRLIDPVGATVPTNSPIVNGRSVSLPIPANLPDGPYVLTWRVVSSDGHPITGASSFGVGTAPAPVPGSAVGTPESTATTVASGPSLPWPVIAIRLVGYVAFALFAGVAAFVLLCAPEASKEPRLQLLARTGLVAGAAAAVAAIVVQGPYTAGVSISRALDMRLLLDTLATPFGTAMICRLGLYGLLGILVWRLPRMSTELASWLVPAAVVGTAVTIAGAGHAAAAGLIDIAIDTLHALTAGLWVGGLVVLVALGRSVPPRVLHQFSTLALASVLTLIVTGTLNSLRQLNAVDELWQTRYGLTLMTKLTLVAGTIAAAAISRRRLHQTRLPIRSVRLEAALTVAVLVVTALLSMTSPPLLPSAGHAEHAGHVTAPAAASAAVTMPLGKDRSAKAAVTPATTTGSHLHIVLSDTNGQPLRATKVTLKVANPDRDLAPLAVPLTERSDAWFAEYRFPFSGTWKLMLTVDGISQSAVVTSADITIRD